ncbi:MAG: hypothetical protein ACXWU4_00770 [Allosphingosinicella sp.]
MKKIVLTAAATLALGVAACTPAADDAGNNATDVNATEMNAGDDVNGAAIDVDANGAAAVSTTDNALDSIGDAAANTASDVGNAATDTGNAVANVVDSDVRPWPFMRGSRATGHAALFICARVRQARRDRIVREIDR